MLRTFQGKRPRVASSAVVFETAYLLGDVEIGEECCVFPGAVIRADSNSIRIGRGTLVEDNCVFHAADDPMEVGEYVIFGHGVVMHGRKVGNHCLIGNNCTVLEGVEVGELCIIGANAMVPQGMKIPPRSFVVGVPAYIKAPLSEEQLQRLSHRERPSLRERYKAEGL